MTAGGIYISKQKALKYRSHGPRIDKLVEILYLFFCFLMASFIMKLLNTYLFKNAIMKSGFLHHFCFWMLRVFFLVKICQNLDMHRHTSVVEEHWAGECLLPFDGSVLASLTVRSCDRREGRKMERLKSSHLFHAETGVCKTP